MTTTLDLRFEGQSVRMVKDGKDWCWHLGDACAVLDIVNVTQAANRLNPNDLRDLCTTDVTGRQQKQRFITEAGLYDLILESRKPEAKKFRRWIVTEVLPTLRRTGKYTMSEPHEMHAYLDERTQKDLSIDANRHLYTTQGKEALIAYNASVLRDVTDKQLFPKEWKELGKDLKLPSKQRSSGLQVVRGIEPHSAAAVSFEKEWILRGHEQGKVRPHTLKAKDLFQGMIADGMRPVELERMPQDEGAP
jgi:prophage antirepressor-like protein